LEKRSFSDSQAQKIFPQKNFFNILTLVFTFFLPFSEARATFLSKSSEKTFFSFHLLFLFSDALEKKDSRPSLTQKIKKIFYR